MGRSRDRSAESTEPGPWLLAAQAEGTVALLLAIALCRPWATIPGAWSAIDAAAAGLVLALALSSLRHDRDIPRAAAWLALLCLGAALAAGATGLADLDLIDPLRYWGRVCVRALISPGW